MTYSQLITPNPNIACTPGWCLMYVRQTFGLPARYASATEAWEASTTKHTGLDFPEGVAVPVWFGMDREPLGHVVLRMPDGSIYSTSDNSSIPHHHPNLSDLINYYAGWGWPLTYRGWTEDVAGYPVIAADNAINLESTTITPVASEEDDMSEVEKLDISRSRQILEDWDKRGIIARIEAIDARTAALIETTKYVKGPDEPQLYEINEATGELRNIGGAEWEATGKDYRILPQATINRLLGK